MADEAISESLGRTTVDVDRRAMNVGSLRRAQERGQCGDLAGLAETLDGEFLAGALARLGNRDAVLLGSCLDAMMEAVGDDMSGIDGVDADAIGEAAIGDGLGEIDQRRVDGAADREIQRRRVRTDAGDVGNNVGVSLAKSSL